MPRCNLTLKQKCQIIELSSELSTDKIAKKFHVHPTTITRTLQKKSKIFEQASRVNVNFKTVQTNRRGEEHDTLVLNYIRESKEPLSIIDICDKASELAASLGRTIKSKRGWWRRFKVRCNIVRTRVPKKTKSSNLIERQSSRREQNVDRNESSSSTTKIKKPIESTKRKSYTFKVKSDVSQLISTKANHCSAEQVGTGDDSHVLDVETNLELSSDENQNSA